MSENNISKMHKFKVIIQEITDSENKKLQEFECHSLVCLMGRVMIEKDKPVPQLKTENYIVGDDAVTNILFQVLPKFIQKYIMTKSQEKNIILN